MVFNTGPYTVLPDNSILITASMQSETGFPSSHQLKSYVASMSRLKLAARAVLSADAGLLVLLLYVGCMRQTTRKRPLYAYVCHHTQWFRCGVVDGGKDHEQNIFKRLNNCLSLSEIPLQCILKHIRIFQRYPCGLSYGRCD